jgi:prolactin regulatory element-binding protein
MSAKGKERAPEAEMVAPPADKLNLGFPVNSIAVLRDLVVVAGGGGEAKTGIPNALVLCKVLPDGRLSKLCVHSTESDTILHVDAHPKENVFAAVDLQNNFQLWDVKEDQPSFTARKAALSGSGLSEAVRLSRFSKKGDRLLTVDTSDTLRILSHPSLTVLATWPSKQANIQDADWSETGSMLVTTSSDNLCMIWSSKAELVTSLSLPQEILAKEGELFFRHCKFSVEDHFYAAFIKRPDMSRDRNRKGTPGKSFVSKCSIAADHKIAVGLPVTVLPSSHHTCFNVSPDGSKLVFGTADGDLRLLSTSNLYQAHSVKAHGWVVTGACFSSDQTRVLSVSVDHTVRSSSSARPRSLLRAAFLLLVCLLLIAWGAARLLGFVGPRKTPPVQAEL